MATASMPAPLADLFPGCRFAAPSILSATQPSWTPRTCGDARMDALVTRRKHFVQQRQPGKGLISRFFVQLLEKYGTLIERYTALIEKVSALTVVRGMIVAREPLSR
eukprot:SAG31_NODE_2387_length_5809_cov_1.810683_4_plen_107_part_00